VTKELLTTSITGVARHYVFGNSKASMALTAIKK
jgi:hypothetical protein